MWLQDLSTLMYLKFCCLVKRLTNEISWQENKEKNVSVLHPDFWSCLRKLETSEVKWLPSINWSFTTFRGCCTYHNTIHLQTPIFEVSACPNLSSFTPTFKEEEELEGEDFWKHCRKRSHHHCCLCTHLLRVLLSLIYVPKLYRVPNVVFYVPKLFRAITTVFYVRKSFKVFSTVVCVP